MFLLLLAGAILVWLIDCASVLFLIVALAESAWWRTRAVITRR